MQVRGAKSTIGHELTEIPRIRRKKCDETKPFCRRCTSTGRKCDGYANHLAKSCSTEGSPRTDTTESIHDCRQTDNGTAGESWSSSLENVEARRGRNSDLQLCRPPSTTLFSTDQDFFCFDFFRTRTGPEFAAYFDSSIWRNFMLRACFLHPTILQAAMAVGAVHRRFELGISREALEYCEVALRMYRKALRCLKQDIQDGHPNVPQISMVVSMLLSTFETFQGEYDLALAHMSSGLKILLDRNFRTTHREIQYRNVELNYTSLQKLFLRLELESNKLFCRRATILADPDREDAALPEVPGIFAHLEQARDVLFTEVKWIWHTWALLGQGALQSFSVQHSHISRLLQWSMAYAEYTKKERSGDTANQRHVSQLLKVYREVAYLLLLTQIAFHEPDGSAFATRCTKPETCRCHRSCRTYTERREALNAHFARLLILSESVLNAGSSFAYEEHSLCVDSGIGPPLYVGSRDCRSTKVRHQVTSLLERSEVQKRVWDTLGVYTIAEKLSSIEEHAVVSCGVIPVHYQPKWVDITCFFEESRILLRHCRADQMNGGMVWTQEWISF